MLGKPQAFLDDLAEFQRSGNVDPIAKPFANSADVSNPRVAHDHEGEAGTESFWHSYRSAFDSIEFELTRVIEGDNVATLERRSHNSASGKPAFYGSVSVFEHGDAGVVAFRTSFNPASV